MKHCFYRFGPSFTDFKHNGWPAGWSGNSWRASLLQSYFCWGIFHLVCTVNLWMF